jgi:subtilisin family serine protease
MDRRWPGLLVTGALLAALLPGTTVAADPDGRPVSALPEGAASLQLEKPITRTADQMEWSKTKVQGLREARGPQRVIVRLSARPAIFQVGRGASAEKAAYASARAQQARVIANAKAIDKDVTVLGRTGKASNVIMLKADVKTLNKLAKSRDVVAIVPVKDYELMLSETVPYVGGTTVQNKGWKGQGVDIAILDSGVDYTHAALGGAGTESAFIAAYGEGTKDAKNTTLDGLFPTAKIKGGYDYTGEAWPEGDEAPDPDPIDSPDSGTVLGVDFGTDGGHGTHVADIIGGIKGMAPKANLYAVKVCSSVSTACSGIALLNAIEWALDPNGDAGFEDHVDIIHMSLGSNYGDPYDDDLSYAVERATRFAGILTIASAGNGANKPYITGTPAAVPSALSVAQTQVPSAKKFPLVVTAPAGIAGTYKNVESMDWAPIGDGFAGNVQYVGGNGCPGDLTYPAPGSLTGKVALIDRGVCAVSLKTDGAAKAGAIGVLIGLVAPGDAVSFSYGGGDTFVPTLVIQQSLSSSIKTQLNVPATVTVSVNSTTSVSLVGGMAGTSSRGPSLVNRIKPEIGAPGASVSAVSGGGTATQAFGGTSGAAPMVTGAAAMLKSAFPSRSGLEIKAVLMNTAEMDTFTDNALQPGVKAPISRIGGGELRVNRALASPIAAWDVAGQSGSLSFGFIDGQKDKSVTRTLKVRNYTTSKLTYKIVPTFRYSNDKSNGAVTISAPAEVTLLPKQIKSFQVTLRLDAEKLRAWAMNGSDLALDPASLDLMEYDGYIKLDRKGFTGDDADPVHVAWHALPRLSGEVASLDGTTFDPGDTIDLKNSGAGVGAVDFYSLVATSPDIPGSRRGMNSPVIDLKSVGVQTYGPMACGVADDFVYAVAITQWDRRAFPAVPGEFDLYLDTTGDGEVDYIVFTGTMSGSLSDARLLTWVYDVNAAAASAYWYVDNATNDPNTILYFCGSQIGMTADDFGTPITMDVEAYDWYFRDYALTDAIYGIEVAPMAEHYGVDWWDGDLDINGDILPGGTGSLDAADWSVYYGYDPNPSEFGLLIVTNGYRGDFSGGAPRGLETIELTVNPT